MNFQPAVAFKKSNLNIWAGILFFVYGVSEALTWIYNTFMTYTGGIPMVSGSDSVFDVLVVLSYIALGIIVLIGKRDASAILSALPATLRLIQLIYSFVAVDYYTPFYASYNVYAFVEVGVLILTAVIAMLCCVKKGIKFLWLIPGIGMILSGICKIVFAHEAVLLINIILPKSLFLLIAITLFVRWLAFPGTTKVTMVSAPQS